MSNEKLIIKRETYRTHPDTDPERMGQSMTIHSPKAAKSFMNEVLKGYKETKNNDKAQKH